MTQPVLPLLMKIIEMGSLRSALSMMTYIQLQVANSIIRIEVLISNQATHNPNRVIRRTDYRTQIQ